LCEGIVRFARERKDWSLRIVEFSEILDSTRRRLHDGFIARVMNDEIADILASTGKPVVDVFLEKPVPGFAGVDQNASLVGQMAAQHFIEHRFSNFAFCGYNGRRYSDDRRDEFVRHLKLNHYECECYCTPSTALKDFAEAVVMHEHFGMPSDAKSLSRWIRKLPKPVAVFCAHDMRAYQLSEICRANGILVPDEVAILGCDDDELVCQFTDPPISSIDQNAVGIGYAAAAALQQMFDDPSVVPPVAKIKPLRLVERESTRTYPLSPKWLSDALVFIQSSIQQNISAVDVYEHVDKSHTLVDAAFRQQLGTSVQKEIARIRLNEARRLVTTTNMPMKEISKACGYSSLQYFSTSFTHAFGISPSALRA
jgi:LacI family transcriptional regulator